MTLGDAPRETGRRMREHGARIAFLADEVRRCTDVQWQSVAADAHRATLSRYADALLRAAEATAGAQRAWVAHGEAVDEKVREIRRCAEAVTDRINELRREIDAATDALAEGVTAAATAVSADLGAALQRARAELAAVPRTLPEPDSLEWLDLARTLGVRG